MTTIHPCLPETYVVEVNPQSSEGFTRTPVMGWVIEDGRPLPMTLNGKCTLIGGDTAVEFPGGMVEHPRDGLAFENVEAWLDSNPIKRAGAGHERAAKATQTSKPASTSAPSESAGDGAYDIQWDGGTYKSNSWWHYDDGEHEFLFQVDGGEDLPSGDHVAKIKRTEFQDMKKSLDVLTIDDIKNADPLPNVEEDEDEDDDDADDLI